jgi:hypothetical protein
MRPMTEEVSSAVTMPHGACLSAAVVSSLMCPHASKPVKLHAPEYSTRQLLYVTCAQSAASFIGGVPIELPCALGLRGQCPHEKDVQVVGQPAVGVAHALQATQGRSRMRKKAKSLSKESMIAV